MTTQVDVRSGLQTCQRGLIAIGLFSLALNLLLLAVPLYTLSIYDRVLTGRNTDTLVMLTVLVLSILGIIAILEFVRQWISTRLGARLETVLGAPLLQLSLHSDGSAEGDVRALRDLAVVRQMIGSPLVGAIFDLPVVPLYLAVLFLVNWQLGLLALFCTTAVCIVAFLNERLTHAALAEASAHGQVAMLKAQVHSRNAEVIRAMGMFPATLASWGDNNARSLDASDRAARRNAVLNGVSHFLRLALQVLIMAHGAFLVLLDASVSAGILFAASLISARALGPINQIVSGWRSLASAAEAWTRIRCELGRLRRSGSSLSLPAPDATVAFERVSFRPKEAAEPILKGLSFRIEAGDVVGIVGPSGAGKSTMARLLVGALAPNGGTVRIGGDDRRNWEADALGPFIGYVPQDVELFPASVAQNIARMALEPDPTLVVKAARLASCHELIQQLPNGYDTMLGINGFGLSGGERQRVALARAFFGHPRIVVLDEPDASLDVYGEQALTAALQQARKAGITCVVITQRMSIVPTLTKIMVIQDGRIEAYGPREEILQRQLGAALKGARGSSSTAINYTGRFFG